MTELTEKTWEPGEINKHLRQLPAIIAKKNQEAIEAETAVKELKHLITMTEASVKARFIGQKTTASEMNAIAYTESGELHKQMIDLEKTFMLAKARCEYYRDLFDSCRKAANLRIEEARRLEGTLTRRTQ
jgi:hypothetical protein